MSSEMKEVSKWERVVEKYKPEKLRGKQLRSLRCGDSTPIIIINVNESHFFDRGCFEEGSVVLHHPSSSPSLFWTPHLGSYCIPTPHTVHAHRRLQGPGRGRSIRRMDPWPAHRSTERSKYQRHFLHSSTKLCSGPALRSPGPGCRRRISISIIGSRRSAFQP
ncbi:uncharacterized protein BJX67DRAFT_15925 [Aspergillus lucknowensis]|uniref:Uncharacterized protein n=1 Tax=Aspergillus lucknowensis TaxID=176173 RepID=A0ABR4M7X8_9EURO